MNVHSFKHNYVRRVCIFLLGILLLPVAAIPASAEIFYSEESAGNADTIYVAGNPELYPVEYYNPNTGCYEGLFPNLLQYISEQTGLDFTYISAGEENNQVRLAKNKQAELVSACLLPNSELESYLSEEKIIFSVLADGEKRNVCLAFTDIASKELVRTMTAAIDEIPDNMLTGISVSYVMNHQYNSGMSWGWWLILVLLILTMSAAVYLFLELRKQKRLHQQDKFLDPVTGIGNGEYFAQNFKNFISDQARNLYYVAYLAFDITHTNKFFGEEEAENILRYAADVLSKNAADTDIFARITGGGFGIAFQSGNHAGAQERAEQLLHLLNRYSEIFNRDYPILFCAGLSHLKQSDHSCETVLYSAQQGYRYAVEHHLPLAFTDETANKGADKMAERQQEITAALKKQEFNLYLQFVVDKNTKNICGAEALSRWQHPQKGLLSPSNYVAIMEELGNISELDFFIFEKACQQLQNWQNSKFENLFLSCNFTRKSISSENFMERLREIAEKFQFNHSKLIIEITEDVEISNKTAALKNIIECKDAGYQIALDDMGDGYTSFMNLCEYPLDYMKIDKRILYKADTHNGRALLNGMIALAHSMDIKVICEGVETTQHNELICSTTCDFIQGFYYSRAIPQEAAEDFLQKYGAVCN